MLMSEAEIVYFFIKYLVTTCFKNFFILKKPRLFVEIFNLSAYFTSK